MRNLRSVGRPPAMHAPRAPTRARSRRGRARCPAPHRPPPRTAPPGSSFPRSRRSPARPRGEGTRGAPPPPALTDLDLHALEDPEPFLLHRHAGSPARELAGPRRNSRAEPRGAAGARAAAQSPRSAPDPARAGSAAPPPPGSAHRPAQLPIGRGRRGAGREGSAHSATPTAHWLRSRRRERDGSAHKTAPPPHWPRLGEGRGRSLGGIGRDPAAVGGRRGAEWRGNRAGRGEEGGSWERDEKPAGAWGKGLGVGRGGQDERMPGWGWAQDLGGARQSMGLDPAGARGRGGAGREEGRP